MFSTYNKNDVTILLKDITGMVTPLGTAEREKYIQNGTHYSEMLPLEYEPSNEYMKTYNHALDMYSGITAEAVAVVSNTIWNQKKENAVLVSLARAGTSIGILIKRYIKQKYKVDIPHYTVSIIRGKGIDTNAMKYILTHHSPEQIQFVDGWTGKGAIQHELNKAMILYPKVSSGLAVLSDPAYISEKCGTHDDFLIASSCLNSTVSGLLSRTFYRKDVIDENDFHGASFYKELLSKDLTYQFIDRVQEGFDININDVNMCDKYITQNGLSEVKEICNDFNINDINLVKPSIGEATRVLLRRIPWKILVNSLCDNEHLGHLYQLAQEKGVAIEEYPLKNYKACGLIRNLADN